MTEANQFQDKIPAAGGKIEYFYRNGGIATQISGVGFIAMYIVAVSMDGKELLATVSATGIGGSSPPYPQPSILAYIQSDQQGMWGRNCPLCEKYFRTEHIMGDVTWCPYCAVGAPSLAFVSKDQRKYIQDCYDGFARSYIGKKDTSVELYSDGNTAWHYSEEKQQTHFKCGTKGCETQTDIIGDYGYCPRCGKTNARKSFNDRIAKMLERWDATDKTVTETRARQEVWEDLTTKCVSEFEACARHLRQKLLLHPMTLNRKRQVENLNFQKPLHTSDFLKEWFDISLMEWVGTAANPARSPINEAERAFIKKMVQRRHILTHNGGIVDQEYIDVSGDVDVRLGQRIRIRSNEAKRFVQDAREMAMNLMDNIEDGFGG